VKYTVSLKVTLLTKSIKLTIFQTVVYVYIHEFSAIILNINQYLT